MSNDNYQLNFKANMVPAMLHALSIARCTAMMCAGSRERSVKTEFNTLYAELLGQIGLQPGAGLNVDEYKWFAICDAIAGCRTYHWHIDGGTSWGSDLNKNKITIVIDDREYEFDWHFKTTWEPSSKFREIMERMAGLDSVKGPDVIYPGSHLDWKKYNK